MATPVAKGGLGGLNFPLASDEDASVARAFGVYREDKHVPARGLFIIDPEGLIQYHVVHNLSVGRRSQEVLRVLAALQTGGLCREEWMADDQTLDPFEALRPGRYFSHYLIEAEVGSGTFARVYRARDLQLDRPVALKVFKPDCPVTPSAALAEAARLPLSIIPTSARFTRWMIPRAFPSSPWSTFPASRSPGSVWRARSRWIC